MNTEKLERLFFRKKPVLVLTSLLTNGNKKNYSLKMSREIDITVSHLVHTLAKFEAMGLVTSEKNGRMKYLYLTPEGRAIALNFNNIFEIFEEVIDE